ncbi:DUF3153 domain-containing protein [Oscillatoria acuminata]|uniref:DUF3153 domain-containing protein n=1 Tax=Oscillatoria acuminata PCC 6304 TaxID=56110 RepID=K9TFQ1_9CYAN|nr:DUF3153 domain-containing protein [Oscillatoria acuminata]AFY81702.1 Protein of unknown function (DUF3153) [Oscillatoria acuminata PCC 6304]
MKLASFGRMVGEWIQGKVRRSRVWIVLLLVPMLLTGCVEYDVGINFESQTHGEIVQHIQLGERLKAFSSSTAEAWLESIERRTRQLHGQVKRSSDREITVKIPFNNGAELVDKFNQFFNPADENQRELANSPEAQIPDISSVMAIRQRNFLLAIYNHLNYELDLRSLGMISSNGTVIVSPGVLLDLEFTLNTPWGANAVVSDDGLMPEIRNNGRQLVWTLQPGELNHLETRFWVPSPIGIGALIIGVFVGISIFLKDKLLPALGMGQRKPRKAKKPQPEPANLGS